MKEHTRTLFGLAIFYIAVVAIADFFLAKVPTANWLAIGFVFLFFAILITSSFQGLLAKSEVAPEKPAFRRDDELEQLAKVVENALVEGHTESLKALEKRLSALAQAASSYVRGKYGKLESTSESGLQFLSADQEVMHTQTPTGSPSICKKLSAREIENVLSKIEEWLG